MATAVATLPPPAPAPTRRILTRLARSRLAAAAADAVILSFLASMWLLLGAAVAADVGSLSCGEGCRAVDAALQVMKVAAISVALVSPVALLLLLVRAGVSDTQLEEEKAPTRRRSVAAVAREVLCDPVMIGILVSGAFVLLMLVGELLKMYSHVKGSRKDRIGTLINHLGFLGMYALHFFFIHPIVALRVWRLWRKIRPRQ